MSGIAFGCDNLQGAPRVLLQATRRPARLERGPVRTIDVHAHCAFPDAMALMGLKFPAHEHARLPQVLRTSEDQIPARLAAMDDQGIDMEVLSVNPFWYGADPDLAREVVDLQNEGLAEVVARRSDRFVALASVALQHPE